MNLYELLNLTDRVVEVNPEKFWFWQGSLMVVAVFVVVVFITFMSIKVSKSKPRKLSMKRKREGLSTFITVILAILMLSAATLIVIFWGVIVARATAAFWFAITQLTGICIVWGANFAQTQIRLRRVEKRLKNLEGKQLKVGKNV